MDHGSQHRIRSSSDQDNPDCHPAADSPRPGKVLFPQGRLDWLQGQPGKEDGRDRLGHPLEKLNREITTAITTSARKHIPYGNGRSARGPFWNERCEEAVRARDAALELATRQDRTRETVEAHQRARAEADRVITTEKKNYLNEKLKTLKPDTDLWRMIRNLDGKLNPKPV